MGRQKAREEFVAIMIAEGMTLDLARRLMRASTTLQRLAEAVCSIEQPNPRHWAESYNAGVSICGETTSRLVTMPSAATCFACQSELVERRVARLLRGTPFTPVFSGDPRGAVLKVKVPSGRTNSWSQDGICVP